MEYGIVIGAFAVLTLIIVSMPVLVLGGDIYPALGGDYPGNFALSPTQHLATNVTGITVPLSGHWIPKEVG